MICRIFSPVFSNQFFPWRRHFKEQKFKENLFVCLQIWTVASLTYKQQKRVCEFFLSIFFYPRTIFVRSLRIFLILLRKCSVTFHGDWIWQNVDTDFFLALWVRKQEQIKLAKNKIRFDLRSWKIRQFTLFQNSWYSLIASSISFNLI